MLTSSTCQTAPAPAVEVADVPQQTEVFMQHWCAAQSYMRLLGVLQTSSGESDVQTATYLSPHEATGCAHT